MRREDRRDARRGRRRRRARHEPSFEVTNLSLSTRAIEDNLGIGTTPYECAREGIENGTLFPIRFIEGPMPTRKVCVIIARDRTLGAAVNAFLSYLF